MANIDKGFSVDLISLKDEVLVTTGTSNPFTLGYEAPQGSLFLHQSGGSSTLYIKTGGSDTAWTNVSLVGHNHTIADVINVGSSNTIVGVNQSGSALEYKTLTAGSGITINHSANQITISSLGGAGVGTVTSVAASAPAAGLTITGSPITTSGTLTFALADDLGAIEALNTNGILTRTATNTWSARSISAGSSKISITNGDGVAGNPSLDVSESNLTLNNIGGTLGISKGGTNLTSLGTSNQVLGVNSGATSLEYKTITAGVGITITHGANSISVAASAGTGQVIRSHTASITPMSGTTIIPFDNTIPQNTEGTQIWTRTVTPNSTLSKFHISFAMMVDSSTSNKIVTAALFRNGVCIYAASSNTGKPHALTGVFVDLPNTTSPVTYSARFGAESSVTWYVNRTAGANLGGTTTAPYIILELS